MLAGSESTTMKITLAKVLRRAGEFFMGPSPIQAAAQRIAAALAELEIPFAVAGALAANSHGHVQTTENVDLLLTPEGFALFKKHHLGRGWVEQFPGSKGIRDTEHDIRIDILLTGDYPGDGKPKPVAFPDPAAASSADSDGVPILDLEVLVTLKLASGMTAPHRPRDLDDVIQLIRANNLGQDYGERLDPYVRAKFEDLWHAAQIKDEY